MSWRDTYHEANRAFKIAERGFFRMTGSDLPMDERFERAGYPIACLLYGLVIDDIERGARCRREEKVKIYKRAALVFACARQLDNAWHCIEQLLLLRTEKNADHYFLTGYLHLRAKHWEKAVVSYDRSLELLEREENTLAAYTLFHKAMALYKLGLRAEAFACSAESVRIAPKKVIIWELYLRLAEESDDRFQADRARTRIRVLLGLRRDGNGGQPSTGS